MLNDEILQLKSYDDKTGREISNVFPITNHEAVKVENDKNLKDKLTEIDSNIDQIGKKVDSYIENYSSIVNENDKVDYMGKQYSTLKEVNDSNVEYLLRKLNTQKYEGSSITANNTYAKQINNVILKGVTKYKDIHTGDFSDNFDSDNEMNLQLVGGKSNKIIIESVKMVLDNKDIVDIYNNMNYSNVKASLSNDGYFVMNNNGAWLFPKKVWKLKPNTRYTIQASGEGVINATHYSQSGLQSERWYTNYNEGYLQVVATTDHTGTFGLLLRFDVNKKVDFKVFEGDSHGHLIKRKSNIVQITTEELNAINNNIYDYVDLTTNVYVKNIGTRKYQPGDESNNNVLTDKKNTIFKLNEPVITKIDLQGQKLYSYDGTTYYTCQSDIGYPTPILSMEVPTDLAALVNTQQETIQSLNATNVQLNVVNDIQDKLINTTMLAMNEMYTMFEPLLTEMLTNEKNYSNIVDMHVAMVQRGLKNIDDFPLRYKEYVKDILNQK